MTEHGAPTLKAVPSLDELALDPTKALDLSPDIKWSYVVKLFTLLPVLSLPSEGGAKLPVHEDRLIGVEEFAHIIGMSVSWVEKRTDALPVRRSVEGNPRWLKSEVLSWIKKRPIYGHPD